MMLVVASSRVRVGSIGFHSEDLLVELRDRIARSARLPGPAGGLDGRGRRAVGQR